jgi:hypothetical protein
MTLDANTLYIIAWLDSIGEIGWTPGAPEKERIVLRRGDEVIKYNFRFSGPMWFCAECPDRLSGVLPPPFKSARSS